LVKVFAKSALVQFLLIMPWLFKFEMKIAYNPLFLGINPILKIYVAEDSKYEISLILFGCWELFETIPTC
jgi:hypothetical protein